VSELWTEECELATTIELISGGSISVWQFPVCCCPIKAFFYAQHLTKAINVNTY